MKKHKSSLGSRPSPLVKRPVIETSNTWMQKIMRIISLFGAKVAVFVMGSRQFTRKRQNGTETTGVGSLAIHLLKSSPHLKRTAFCRRAQGIVTRCPPLPLPKCQVQSNLSCLFRLNNRFKRKSFPLSKIEGFVWEALTVAAA